MTIQPEQNVALARSERLARLRAVVEGMARRMRPADEDMLSVGIAALWEGIADWGPVDDAYLVAAARNAMIDHIRYQKVRARVQLVAEFIGVAGPSPEDPGALMMVDDLLALLPPVVRRAFELHCLQDYTIAETARRLGTSGATVKRLVEKARKLLKAECEG